VITDRSDFHPMDSILTTDASTWTVLRSRLAWSVLVDSLCISTKLLFYVVQCLVSMEEVQQMLRWRDIGAVGRIPPKCKTPRF